MSLTTASHAAELHHHLDAAPDVVFAAFADPALVRRWLTPGPEVGLEVLAFDFHVGGAYRFAYRVPGAAIMHVNGVFRVIEPPDEHAGIQSEVRIAIAPDVGGCELCITHVELTQAGAPERHAEGWRGAVEQLAALLKEDVHGG